MDSLALQRPDWIKSNYINIIAQESLVRPRTRNCR